MKRRKLAAVAFVAAVAVTVAVVGGMNAPQKAQAGPTAFSNIPLIATWQLPDGYSSTGNSTGDSEPAIAFASDGTMAVDGLAWLPWQVNLWTGKFGSKPAFFGGMDQNLRNKGVGRTTLGDGDADVEFTGSGTLLLADLDFNVNPLFNNYQLGVSVTRCARGAAGPSDCSTAFLDQSGSDRQWITTNKNTAWVAYHDSQNSTMIRVKKSTDDGRTWKTSGSPVVGQGDITGNSTYNNSIGPIVADPTTGYVYAGYTSGEQQTKCCSAAFNNLYVSRSTDGGDHYTTTLVYHAPPLTDLANFWPVLAVDPANGQLWVAWTDRKGVYVSTSTDHAATWSPALKVSSAANVTTVMPWVAARNGKVDVVYYASTASSVDDTSAIWNAFDAQLSGGSWKVKQVSNTPVRSGAVCLNGSACKGNRELLDLFEVAEDPISGKAAVIYSDTTRSTWTGPDGLVHQLPEIVLAYEN